MGTIKQPLKENKQKRGDESLWLSLFARKLLTSTPGLFKLLQYKASALVARKIPSKQFGFAFSSQAVLLPVLLICTLCTVSAQTWPGPTFQEFAGENSGNPTPGYDPLIGYALDWNRPGGEIPIYWSRLEPSQGTWDLSYLSNFGAYIQTWPSGSSNTVPILMGIPSWEDRRTPSQWLPDWTDYVNNVVSYLYAPPYNVRYFQIWNEPYGQSTSFWPNGTWSDFFTYVHFPAAQVIHSYPGAKVVFGGYPSARDSSITDYINQLDTYGAWSSIDVLDTHYYTPYQWIRLRAAADSRGYPDMAMWQTEVGWTTYNTFVANEYTRTLFWALNNNWDTRDKYKWFFFTHWDPNSNSLYTGSPGTNLTCHGQQLWELGTLFGNNVLSAYSGITSSLSGLNQTSYDRTASSLEGIQSGNTIVAAVHLSPTDYNNNASVTLTFPLSVISVTSAQRVDLTGNTVDLATTGTTTTSVSVDTQDASDSSALTWNSNSVAQGKAATFYVVLATANTPDSASRPRRVHRR